MTGIDRRIADLLAREQAVRVREGELQQLVERVGGGGGGGDGGHGVEARVGRLEAGQDDIKKTLGDIKVTLATLDERTKHMPTRWEAFLIIAAVVGVFGSAIGIAVRFIPV